MSIDSLLNQLGTLEAPDQKNRYGNPSFGERVVCRCRFERVTKTILNTKGESEPINGRAFLSAGSDVGMEYRFTFQDVAYRVMVVSEMVDGRGVTRQFEIMLQVWR